MKNLKAFLAEFAVFQLPPPGEEEDEFEFDTANPDGGNDPVELPPDVSGAGDDIDPNGSTTEPCQCKCPCHGDQSNNTAVGDELEPGAGDELPPQDFSSDSDEERFDDEDHEDDDKFDFDDEDDDFRFTF